ncbi:MAG: hypothetical protein ACD_6C00745G0001, partial [uncultured bacterium]
LATFELLSQVVPPAVFESCRAEIPPEFGRLNLTRSSVALHKYKKSQQQNSTASSSTVQESASRQADSSNEKNKSTNSPSKDTKPPKQKESEVIQNPEAEPEMSKQDLIKYISKQRSPSSNEKNEEKDTQEKADKEPEDEKTTTLWEVNPDVVENYWSSTQRD